jgi:hypothetical protein
LVEHDAAWNHAAADPHEGKRRRLVDRAEEGAMKRVLIASLVVFWLIVSATAGATALAPQPLAAHQEPRGIGNLVVPGDAVHVVYTLDTKGVAAPTGSLYVRTDTMSQFEQLTLKATRSQLQAGLPARLLQGHRLFYYAVIRDPKSGRSVTVPHGGAHAPTSAWILSSVRLVNLGVHRFGHDRSPDATVARVAATDVAWQSEGDPFGPQTFLVDRDGTIYLDDGLNDRLLVFRKGAPDTVARTIPLPSGSADSDVALGPNGSIYVKGGIGHGVDFRNVVYRVSATGTVLWRSLLPGDVRNSGSFLIGANSPLRTGPDGTLYCLVGMPGRPGGQFGWMPVATPGGRPLTIAEQLRRTSWPGQPVARGLRLVTEVYSARANAAPREARVALVDRAGRVVRAWRIVSRTDINFGYATPEVVNGDPIVALDVTAGMDAKFKWEYLVLRLGPNGVRTQLSLRRTVFGDNILADVRIGPDGSVYQLGSSPASGVAISRYAR